MVELVADPFDNEVVVSASTENAAHPPTPRWPTAGGDNGSSTREGLEVKAESSESAGGSADGTKRPSILDMMTELAAVRRASARIDEQLKGIKDGNGSSSQEGSNQSDSDPLVLSLPPPSQPTPSSATETLDDTNLNASSPLVLSAEPTEDDELAQLRAQLAAVRAQSAMMEAALARTDEHVIPVRHAPPPPPAGALPTATPSASPKGSPKPMRAAPPPPLKQDAVVILDDDNDDDFDVMPLVDLSSREIRVPRPVLKPASPRDNETLFPPSVWLGCVLDAHAVITANEVWGFDQDSSDDDDDDADSLIELAMANLRESSLDVERKRSIEFAESAVVEDDTVTDHVNDADGYVAIQNIPAAR